MSSHSLEGILVEYNHYRQTDISNWSFLLFNIMLRQLLSIISVYRLQEIWHVATEVSLQVTINQYINVSLAMRKAVIRSNCRLPTNIYIWVFFPTVVF